MTDVDPLVEFIRARLDYEERPARALAEIGLADWEMAASVLTVMGGDLDRMIHTGSNLANRHVERQDPAHTLRRIGGMRKVLQLHRQVGRIHDPRRDKMTFDHKIDICEVCGPFEWPHGTLPNGEFGYLDVWHDAEGYPTLYPCRTVRLMGTEWSTHEDYVANREVWKP